MPRIVLTTLNARWSHCAAGLRCLRANLGDLRDDSVIREFTINDDLQRIVERLLEDTPTIIGLGIYVWNRRETEAVMRLLRAVAPHIRLVIGGPEATHADETDELIQLSDVRITGEADVTFREVCEQLLANHTVARTVRSPDADLTQVALPYGEYSDHDLAHRLIYVEASRGCPFTCEFCLSSIADGVRQVPIAAFLEAMAGLLARGNRTFKFVDRTFNLSPSISAAILQFFLDRWRDDIFLHFELVPDRLPEALKALIVRFPPGAVQFEIGIQSFTPEVGVLISRRMNREATERNLIWLRDHSGIHVHADLIIGLPGETPETFQQSFDALWHLNPGEIQVGILKLLKGTPISRHIETHGLRFNPDPPYDLLESATFSFALMMRLKRFARYHDRFANTGVFTRGLTLLIAQSPTPSPFNALLGFADWMWRETGDDHGLALPKRYLLLRRYLIDVLGADRTATDDALAHDIAASGADKGIPTELQAAVERARRTIASGSKLTDISM